MVYRSPRCRHCRPTAHSALAGTTLLGVYLALRHAVLRVAFGAKRGPHYSGPSLLHGAVNATALRAAIEKMQRESRPPPPPPSRCVRCDASTSRAFDNYASRFDPRAAAAAGARRPIAQVRLLAERHTGSKSFDSWLASHLCACERAGCAHVARSGFLRHRHWCAVARDSLKRFIEASDL
jgi:hypothetical protein